MKIVISCSSVLLVKHLSRCLCGTSKPQVASFITNANMRMVFTLFVKCSKLTGIGVGDSWGDDAPTSTNCTACYRNNRLSNRVREVIWGHSFWCNFVLELLEINEILLSVQEHVYSFYPLDQTYCWTIQAFTLAEYKPCPQTTVTWIHKLLVYWTETF